MGGFLASAGAKQLLQMLAVSAGSDIIAGLGESLRGESPFEQSMNQQSQYMNQMLPDLYKESQGIPSMATSNLMRESGANINREQQSYMASQMRANPYSTRVSTPTRAGSTRFMQAKQDANRNIMGQAQQNARGQLMGLGQNAQTMIGLAEQKREQRRSEFNTNIMDFLGFYEGLNDPVLKNRLRGMMDMIKGQFAAPITNEPKW